MKQKFKFYRHLTKTEVNNMFIYMFADDTN